MNKEGILYIATGKKYIEEVINSATSCKKVNNYPIALITDSKEYELPAALFDIIIYKDASYSYKDKLLLKHSPFENTIFIDTDTLILGDLSPLFRILDFREFAIHQADEGYEFPDDGLSIAMPEFNTGVIAFRKCDTVSKLFKDWESSFSLKPEIMTDQFHLKRVLYESDVRYATFSSAYNFIIYYPNYVITHAKVLHGRPFSTLEKIAMTINYIPHNAAWRRTFYPFNNNWFILYAQLTVKDSFRITRLTFRIFAASLIRPIRRIFNNKIGKIDKVKSNFH